MTAPRERASISGLKPDAPPTVRQVYALAAVLCELCDEEFPKDREAASGLIERFRRQLGHPSAAARRFGAPRTARLDDRAVVDVDDAVAETAFVQQFELHADIGGQGRLPASHHDRREEQVELVDQAGLDRLGGELRTSHGDVTNR